LVLLALLAAACKSGDPPGADDKALQPIPAEEVKRGDTACRALAEQTCTCAATKPELQQACAEAKELPEALRMGVQAAEGDDLEPAVRRRLQYDARKTMGVCFEKLNQLAALGCR
jgi:hypothetical protein